MSKPLSRLTPEQKAKRQEKIERRAAERAATEVGRSRLSRGAEAVSEGLSSAANVEPVGPPLVKSRSTRAQRERRRKIASRVTVIGVGAALLLTMAIPMTGIMTTPEADPSQMQVDQSIFETPEPAEGVPEGDEVPTPGVDEPQEPEGSAE